MNYLKNFFVPSQSNTTGNFVFQSYDSREGRISRIKNLSNEQLTNSNIEDILSSSKTYLDSEFTQGGRIPRRFPRRMYANCIGIVYYVKECDQIQIEESQQEFHKLLNEKDLSGVPLLLIVKNESYKSENKLENSDNQSKVAESLKLFEVIGDRPVKIQLVSSVAVQSADEQSKNSIEELKQCFSWLCDCSLALILKKEEQRKKQEESNKMPLASVFEKNPRKTKPQHSSNTGDGVSSKRRKVLTNSTRNFVNPSESLPQQY